MDERMSLDQTRSCSLAAGSYCGSELFRSDEGNATQSNGCMLDTICDIELSVQWKATGVETNASSLASGFLQVTARFSGNHWSPLSMDKESNHPRCCLCGHVLQGRWPWPAAVPNGQP